MTEIEKVKAEIKVLEMKLSFLEELEKTKSPVEEAYKDRWGEYSGPSMTNCIINGNPPNGYVTWIEWYNELGSKGILHNLRISSIEAEKLKEKERNGIMNLVQRAFSIVLARWGRPTTTTETS